MPWRHAGWIWNWLIAAHVVSWCCAQKWFSGSVYGIASLVLQPGQVFFACQTYMAKQTFRVPTKKKSKGAYAVARGGGKWSKHAERNSTRTHVRYTICTLIILSFSLSRIHAHTCACTQALSCRVDKPVLSGAIVWLACCPVILSCSPSSFLFERSRFCLLLFLSQFQRTSAGINPQVECKVDAGHLKHWKTFFF